MATSVGRSVAGRMIGRRGVNQSDGRSIGRLVESVRRSVGPTITHCPQLTIRYPYPRYPLVEPLSNTSFSCSYPRSLSFLPSFLPSFLSSSSSSSPHSLSTTYHITFHSLHTTHCPTTHYSLPLPIIHPSISTHHDSPSIIHHPHSSSTQTPRTTHYPQPTAQGPLPAAAAQERISPLRPAPLSAAEA